MSCVSFHIHTCQSHYPCDESTCYKGSVGAEEENPVVSKEISQRELGGEKACINWNEVKFMRKQGVQYYRRQSKSHLWTAKRWLFLRQLEFAIIKKEPGFVNYRWSVHHLFLCVLTSPILELSSVEQMPPADYFMTGNLRIRVNYPVIDSGQKALKLYFILHLSSWFLLLLFFSSP